MSITDQSTAVTATSSGVSVTASGSTHTKGAWVELIASTSEETYWLQLAFNGAATLNDTQFMIDIGVGAAASEVVIIANIPVFANFAGIIPLPPMPRTIASGARVSIRVQSATGSAAIQCMLFLSNNDEFGTSTANETIGSDTATSKGTPVDTGGTLNTKGAYAELTSSLSISANYFVVMLGGNNNAGQTTMVRLFDIATGAAASEVDQLSNALYASTSAELQSDADSFFQSLGSGDRISCRGQSSNTNAADRIFDASVIAFNIIAPTGGSGGIAQIVGQGGIVG